MLAVGNLSCSLHDVRSRHPSSTTSAPDERSATTTSPRLDTAADAAATTTSSPRCRSSEPPMPGPAAPLVSSLPPRDLVPRPRLRSLCSGALRLAATEPDHAAGSAVRALGYLAWGLDPANNGGGSSRRRGGGGGSGGDGLTERGKKRSANRVPSLLLSLSSGRGGEGGGGEVCARGEEGDGSEDETDRGLQDETVVALSTRLALEKESLAPPGVGGRGGGGDRRAEMAAAKCR